MLSIVLFVIAIKCIQSEDICDFIQTNDKFVGLKMYHKYYSIGSTGSGVHENIMYRKEKEFSFFVRDNVLGLEIDLNNSTVNLLHSFDNQVIVNRFGFDGKDCFILTSKTTDKTEILCKVGTTETVSDNQLMVPSEAVIFNPTTDPKNDFVLVLEKSVKKIGFIDSNITYFDENQCSNMKGCVVPDFVRQLMTKDILNFLDGIVYYGIHGGVSSGHVLFFNVDSKPKYCNISVGIIWSTDCDLENLTIYGKNCFSDLTTITTSIGSTDLTVSPNSETTIPTKEGIKNFQWIALIFAVIVIALVIGVIIGFVAYKTSQKSKTQTMPESIEDKVPKESKALETPKPTESEVSENELSLTQRSSVL